MASPKRRSVRRRVASPRDPSRAAPATPAADHAPSPWAYVALLARLPQRVRRDLEAVSRPASVAAGTVVVEANETMRHVHFPTSCVMSVLSVVPDGRAVEVGTVGPEGMVGISLVLGVWSMPTRCICQVAGDELHVDTPDFITMLDRHADLRALLMRYTQAFLGEVGQSVACNRLHTLEQRCARRILATHDRVPGDFLPLTQQFLASMLGVRRAGVSVAAESLQAAGFIRYQRGKIRVLDREGLEQAACDCYLINRANFARTVGAQRLVAP